MLGQILKKTESNLFFLQRPKVQKIIEIKTSDQLNDFCRTLYDSSIAFRETVFALFFDYSKNCIGVVRIGEGDEYGSIIDTQLLLRSAILLDAYSVTICHNHPNGSLMFSKADSKSAKVVQKLLKPFAIELQREIILSGINNEYIVNHYSV